MHGPPPRLTATEGVTDPGRPTATAKTTTGSASSPAHSGSRRLPRSGCLAGATFTARRQRRRRLHARAARTNPLRGQPALEEIRSRVGVAASRDAVIGLEQGRISRSWQPDATISRWRPWPNPGFRMFSGKSGTNGTRPGCTCGTSGPGTQRSRSAASTTSRLSHPVSPHLPRLAARPHGAWLLLHFLLQRPARKRPSPCRERALTCGN